MQINHSITKKNLILFGLFFFRLLPCFAHQPDMSTMMLYQDEKGRSFLQIYSSLTAFEGEIDYKFSKNAYKTAEQFKSLVIKHFEKNVFFILNSKDTLRFGQPKVILGHETKLVCEVFGFPKNTSELLIKNAMFKNIPNNQSMVILLQKGLPHEQFTLNNDNQQQINLKLINGSWQPNVSTNFKSNYLYIIVLFVLLILVIFILYYKRFAKGIR
jgi:hypothetical protein